MNMKMFKIILIIKFLLISSLANSEPFVVLEYADKDDQNYDSESRSHNDENYSTKHTVKKNETLSKIIHKYYGNKGLNLTFVQSAILYKNKSAFVRSNPNFLYAQKNLYLPSINEIKELIYKRKNKNKPISNDAQLNKEIYFFGN